mmetsp:Transcript_73022/g.173971  ORF Transcript_73022/g.173971 Transcript_73022/m.173971 type:complete len:81 (-) Transcript_73022:651-893(-)
MPSDRFGQESPAGSSPVKRRSLRSSLAEDAVNDTRSSLARSSIAFLEWHEGDRESGRSDSFGDDFRMVERRRSSAAQKWA